MLIPKETIQDAKEKLGDGNADLIAQILELKEYDQKNMRSLCPFHEEKTPSFIYDTKRHCFHCFGKCGINVDAVTAYMHTGMTYVEACKEFFEQAKVKFAFGEHKVKTKKQYKYPVGVPINDKKIIYKYLGLRQISKETIDYCDVREDKHGNVVFNFYDSNDTLTLVKYRPSHAIDKTKGEIKCWCEKDADTANILFNMNRINVSEPLLVTEGEVDQLAAVESGYKNSVSVPLGANNYGWIEENWEWLEQFDSIILAFDNDEAGRKAVEDCITLFPAGKVKVVQHPEFKDANEILMNKGTGEVANTFYNAREFRPDGFVCPDALLEEALKPIEIGIPWMYPRLTEITYGRRYGEIVTIGAGVAVGKTDFLMQQIAFDITNNHRVATFMLEQGKVETLLRVCGKIDACNYHLPDVTIDKTKLSTTIHSINDKLFIYDNFGRIDWETIKAKIRSASLSYGIKLFYIDNLTALNAHAEDERRHLDGLMEEVASLAKELNVWILMVSHLNPVKRGASHEAGGRVEQAMFTGSRAIMRWSSLMLGIERNTLADTPEERQRGLVRCIKDRFSGKATGKTISFIYDTDTGVCHPTDETFDVVGKDDSGDDF